MAKTVQLSIPTACHEDWHAMTPDEKGRYCMSCRKTVVDFTNMSDREILNHISKSSGGVCGRLHADQLNRKMVMQKEGRLPWLKYFIQFTIPALFVTMKTRAQESKKPVVVQSIKDPRITMVPAVLPEEYVVKGRVIDEDSVPLAGATVWVKGTSRGTVTDADGNFSLKFIEDEFVTLSVSYIGFETFELRVATKSELPASVIMKMQMTAFTGLIILGGVHTVTPKPSALEKLRSIITPDSVRIFPNPVGVGNDLKLQLQVKQAGNYYMEIADFNGRLVRKAEITARAEKCQAAINTNQLLPGRYIVCVRDAAGKKIGVKKIILQ